MTFRNCCVLLTAFFLVSVSSTYAEEPFSMAKELASITYEESPFPLRATVMEIDLENNSIIVAEKYIHLLSSIQNGEKKWVTRFLDADYQSISPETLQIRDRVIVEGRLTENGTLEAVGITLRPPDNRARKTTITPEVEKPKNAPYTIRKVNGVWVN